MIHILMNIYFITNVLIKGKIKNILIEKFDKNFNKILLFLNFYLF
jgi:hypothetical protein